MLPGALSPANESRAPTGAVELAPGEGRGRTPALAAHRILVIRLGALGDVVRTRFAFAGLRALYPRARIEWLVEDRAAPGLAGIAGLDEIVQVPRRELR